MDAEEPDLEESLVDEEPEEQYLESPSGNRYQVGESLGEAERFNLYACPLAEGRCGMLKIASSAVHNAALDREAFVLRLMTDRAAEVEAKSRDKKRRFNYSSFFPELIESFIAPDQDDRRVNILGFPKEITVLSQLTPITALADVEKVRIDPRTAAWMLGKLLKVLSFAHDQGITNGLVIGNNVLIEREYHGVVLFDWTLATINNDSFAPPDLATVEMAEAAIMVIDALGGDLEKGYQLPPSDQLTDERFSQFLFSLARGGDLARTSEAHRRFYDLIWSLWPREFHPFTTLPLERRK